MPDSADVVAEFDTTSSTEKENPVRIALRKTRKPIDYIITPKREKIKKR